MGYDSDTGTLQPLADPVLTVPEGTKVGVDGQSFPSAIRISPDGRFVYASNRGHCSIATFAVKENGMVSLVCWQLTTPDVATQVPPIEYKPAFPPRDCPRDFILCGEQGEWVIAGNQDSDSIVVFTRDVDSGILAPANVSIACPA